MKYSKDGTTAHEELRKKISGVLRQHPNGVSKDALKKHCEINPNTEADRSKVWKMVSALVGLCREGFAQLVVRKDQHVYFAKGV